MKKIRQLLSILFLFLFVQYGWTQIITSRPTYPTVDDSVVIVFDAKLGDQGLKGYAGTDVYAHTGIITDKSTSDTDWKYVKASWTTNLPECKLIKVGEDLWELNIGKIRSYYNIPRTEKVLKLAFVFRDSSGSKTGRDVGGKDILYGLFEHGLTVVIQQPSIDLSFGHPLRSPVFTKSCDTVNIHVKGVALNTQVSTLELFINGLSKVNVEDSVLTFDFIAADYKAGPKWITVIGKDTAEICDKTDFYIVVNPEVRNFMPPPGVIPGINYIIDGSVVLSLFAPRKQFVYVIGDINDWKVDTTYYMNRYQPSADSTLFWIRIDSLNARQEYGFQYFVDSEIRIADPYTEKVLDPWNDGYITPATYPYLKPYPLHKTAEPVSVLQTATPEYQWQTTAWEKPKKHELIIYELLIRDFTAAHDYKTLADTLDYLEKLGVNTIELMPINEFEGNLSWGYNPSFYFAPDKYYGRSDDLKWFIDECHARGIAVIQDIVLNHSYGQSPLVRLYWDSAMNRPSAENPWYNQTSPNPVYSWGYDFNHESIHTKAFVDRVTRFWMTEYKIDGFRFDFTKGFSNHAGDGWAYDDSRIAILKRIADRIWETDSTAYVLLEHFTDNLEEKELADYGMMLWGNLSHDYQEAAMGYSSDLSWGFYRDRLWTKPHLITYMESHDEERLMYKNLQWGNVAGSYNIKELRTALNRIKLNAAFFLTLPGPKMIWQFGEVGYDISIDNPCRTCEKPILWDYLEQSERLNLYKIFAALLKLRAENSVFTSPNTTPVYSLNGYLKEIAMTGNPNTIIIGNFGVANADSDPNFQHGGLWYDYFSGDSFYVAGVSYPVQLAPGEFHIYTDRKLTPPDPGIINGINDSRTFPSEFALKGNYPNPFNATTHIRYEVEKASEIRLEIFDINGRMIFSTTMNCPQPGRYEFLWNGTDIAGRKVGSGIYFAILKRENRRFINKMALLK